MASKSLYANIIYENIVRYMEMTCPWLGEN